MKLIVAIGPWQYSVLFTLLLVLFLSHTAATDQTVLSKNAKLSNESLLWGPYRPNLYFGVKPRLPKSISTGLLWAKVDDFRGAQESNVTCIQSSIADRLTNGIFYRLSIHLRAALGHGRLRLGRIRCAARRPTNHSRCGKPSRHRHRVCKVSWW